MKSTAYAKTVKTPQGLAVENSVREFSLVCDEPVESGGTNTGMNPVEALLSALGSCMTIAAFYLAESQGIKLESFSVDLEGDIDTDGFMGVNPDLRCGFSEIRVTAHIKCDADEARAKEFVAFVKSRCPVSDNVANPTPIVVSGIVVE